MEDCTPQCWATKVLVIGIIIILVRTLTPWDIWLVLGILLVIKAIIMYLMPVCKCQETPKKNK